MATPTRGEQVAMGGHSWALALGWTPGQVGLSGGRGPEGGRLGSKDLVTESKRSSEEGRACSWGIAVYCVVMS